MTTGPLPITNTHRGVLSGCDACRDALTPLLRQASAPVASTAGMPLASPPSPRAPAELAGDECVSAAPLSITALVGVAELAGDECVPSRSATSITARVA